MKPSALRRSLWIMGTLVLCPTFGVAEQKEEPVLAEQVRAVLKTHCHGCHGRDGAAEGGFNYILDLDRLVARGKVRPGAAEQSPLFKRVAAGKMPPPDVKHRPSADDVSLLRRWVDAGALRPAVAQRPLLTDGDIYARLLDDLEKHDRRGRRFLRYFSLVPQHNAGLAADELQTYRHALSKLINSLSWHYRITPPIVVDAEHALLRIDLRDYQWDANLWNRLLNEYPYGLLNDSATARAVHVATGTRMPVVRADWFVATASRPPLYHDLLQLPTSAAELERQLRVDAATDIQQERVARAGFNGSGISKQNRLLERHDALHGAYWRSYDFDPIPQNLLERELQLPDRRNLFAYPLGPGFTENTFRHAGGELIFNLPNGLQAYMLVNADGLRVDKAPSNIVSDPKRPDRAVETGLSCISCHVQGINPKDDQIRSFVEQNAKSFSRADAELIQALHVPAAKMRKLMDEDADRFRKAVEKTGAKLTVTEPIVTMALRYEADLDAITAAAELGLPAADLQSRLGASETLARNLGALKVAGGAVQRQVWIQAFPELARELRLGPPFQPLLSAVSLPDATGDLDPLEAPSGLVNAAAFTSDGRFALLASADKSIRVWELERNIELRRLVGHTGSVWCVAISPDGKQALSGGADHTVRWWDVETGRELKRLHGHTALVAAIVFSPDGRRALSAGYDRTLIRWNLETGAEEHRVPGQANYLNAVLFAPDGRQVLVATGKSILIIERESGRTNRYLSGHANSVTSVALSPDGYRIVSGSDDKTVRLWERETGRLLHTLEGHTSHVKNVSFSPDGKRVASGSADGTVRLWDAETGKELKRYGPLPDSVVAVAFIGVRGVVAALRDGTIRTWGLARTTTPDIITVPTAEYLRPTKNGFTRECEFTIDQQEDAWTIASTTYRGGTTLNIHSTFDKDRRLTSADMTLQVGTDKKTARVQVTGDKAVVKRDGQQDQEFTVPKGVIVTSAPDWTDTFLLCRQRDSKGPSKQEFKGLWIHPTQQAQLLTFTIEQVGIDHIEHLGQKQEVVCCLIRLRGNSPYSAWMDQRGRLLKLVPLPYKEGAQNELVLKGYEKSAAPLLPPDRVRSLGAKP